MTLLPRSLTGRLALVLALALLVAQGVSFALLARAQDRAVTERQAYAALLPIAASLAAETRDEGALPPRFARRRARRAARRVTVSDAPPEGRRLPRVEALASEVLAERGLTASEVAVVRAERSEPGERPGLVVAARRADGAWIRASAPPPPRRGPRLVPLAVQTLFVYLALLLPVLWIARQVARPLATLTAQARRWRAGQPPAAVPPRAPGDVAELARGLAAMQARVTEAARERDAMLGAVGHDLRTPLTSLRLRAEQVADEALRAKMVATLEETGRLLEDTLTLARSGHPEGEPVRTDLAALAREAVEAARAAGQRAEVGGIEPAAAAVYPAALSRALGNLIANADRHAGGGTVGLRREGGEAVLTVTDEGPGLPEGFALGAFVRGEGSRSRATGGAGLGLAIARRVAEAHGGRLDLVAREGGGTVARLVLSLAR